MATSEGIPSSIDIEFLELNDNPYLKSYICNSVAELRISILVSVCFGQVSTVAPKCITSAPSIFSMMVFVSS